MKKNKPSESDHSTLPLISRRDLRRAAEVNLSKRRKKNGNLPTTDDAARLVQELQVHQIELDMQNEELAQSRAEAEAAYRQYVNLYDLAPVGYLTLARDGTIRKINPAGANLLGMQHDELVKRRLSVFVSTESRPAYNVFFEKLLSGKGKKTCELEFKKKEDDLLWARLEAICFEDRQECNLGIMDISDRKQAEHQTSERMKELQAFYSLTELIEKEGITLDNLYQEVADILSKSCQYPEIACARVVMGNSEFRTKNFVESAWMESAPVKVNGSAAGNIEVGYLKRKPKENEGPFLKEERLVLNAIAERLGRITERMHAEEALRVSEEKYHVLFDMFPIGITIADGNGKILESNHGAERLLGISKEEQEQRAIDGVEWQIIRTDGSVMPPDEYASIRALKEKRLIENIEMGIVKGKGIVTWINVTAVPLGHKVVITYHNITRRKQAEDKLRESEERYRLLFNSMTEGFALHELVFDQNGEPCDYRFLDVNRAFEELTGLKRDDIIGRVQREILPAEDSFWFKTYCKVALTGESIHLEHYSPSLQRHYEVYAYCPVSNQFAVVFKNITERKQAEEALHLSELGLKEAQSVARIGNWKWDVKKGEITWSDEMFSIFGVDKNSYSGRLGDVITKVIHPDDLHLVLPSNAPTFVEKKPIEYRIILPDGSIRHIWAKSGYAVVDDEGNTIFLTGIAQDITERKQAEDDLRKSEERLRDITFSMADWVWEVDENGVYTYSSQKGIDLFGLFREEIIGKTPFDFMSADETKRVSATFSELVANKSPIKDLENWNIRKNGERICMLTNAVPILDKQGNFKGYRGVDKDITERKKIEDALLFLLQSGYSDNDFFMSLARYLSNSLDMDYVCIDRLSGDQLSAQTVAIYFDGKFEDNTAYALKDTPCGNVVGNTVCVFPSQVRHLFPKDVVLQEMVAESYVGTTLWSLHGQPIGLIAVIGRKPMETAKRSIAEAILKLVAVRAAGELERKQAEDKLLIAKEALEAANFKLQTAFAHEQQLARTDMLTGVNNRRHLFELAERAFDVAARYQQPLSVIMLDIDNFKNINDVFGHALGDQMLQRVTQAVCAELRSVDIIGRYGGEEFVIILPMTNAQDAYSLAERIRVGVAAVRIPTEKGDAAVTLSIGITETKHTSGESLDSILICADQAMYTAKQTGRNRTIISMRSEE